MTRLCSGRVERRGNQRTSAWRDTDEMQGLWLFMFCFVSIKFHFQPVVVSWLLRFASGYYKNGPAEVACFAK